jgi:hypothetical protein
LHSIEQRIDSDLQFKGKVEHGASVQDVDVVLVHTGGQLIVHGVARSISDGCKLFMADQVVVDTIFMIE